MTTKPTISAIRRTKIFGGENMTTLKDNTKVTNKKIENFARGVLFGFVYVLIVTGIGLFLKFELKLISFTLISCAVYGIYLQIIDKLDKKGYLK